MTSTTTIPTGSTADLVAHEIAVEQAHVDRVHRELLKATERANSLEADGLARGRTDRVGDVRDEEITGLFERDALVYAAARRRFTIENQYEGLVFGRLDLDTSAPNGTAGAPPNGSASAAPNGSTTTAPNGSTTTAPNGSPATPAFARGAAHRAARRPRRRLRTARRRLARTRGRGLLPGHTRRADGRDPPPGAALPRRDGRSGSRTT